MICQHQSIKERHTGQTDDCVSCRLPIIFDGKRWSWLYSIDLTKTRKLKTAFMVDQITGAH